MSFLEMPRNHSIIGNRRAATSGFPIYHHGKAEAIDSSGSRHSSDLNGGSNFVWRCFGGGSVEIVEEAELLRLIVSDCCWSGDWFLVYCQVFAVLTPLLVERVALALGFFAFAQTFGITMASTTLQNTHSSTLPADFVAQFPEGAQIAYAAILIKNLPEPLRSEDIPILTHPDENIALQQEKTRVNTKEELCSFSSNLITYPTQNSMSSTFDNDNMTSFIAGHLETFPEVADDASISSSDDSSEEMVSIEYPRFSEKPLSACLAPYSKRADGRPEFEDPSAESRARKREMLCPSAHHPFKDTIPKQFWVIAEEEDGVRRPMLRQVSSSLPVILVPDHVPKGKSVRFANMVNEIEFYDEYDRTSIEVDLSGQVDDWPKEEGHPIFEDSPSMVKSGLGESQSQEATPQKAEKKTVAKRNSLRKMMQRLSWKIQRTV
ncbi:hypothetical protein C8J56DRAFT_1156883 [Mycena floridula]|nr:hypothetical protein C8J56DRAFT_1156883 [Mycena floridula]